MIGVSSRQGTSAVDSGDHRADKGIGADKGIRTVQGIRTVKSTGTGEDIGTGRKGKETPETCL